MEVPPLCPIVSSIGTNNYKLAKFLTTVLLRIKALPRENASLE